MALSAAQLSMIEIYEEMLEDWESHDLAERLAVMYWLNKWGIPL